MTFSWDKAFKCNFPSRGFVYIFMYIIPSPINLEIFLKSDHISRQGPRLTLKKVKWVRAPDYHISCQAKPAYKDFLLRILGEGITWLSEAGKNKNKYREEEKSSLGLAPLRRLRRTSKSRRGRRPVRAEKRSYKDYHTAITAFSRIFNSTYVSHVVAPSDDFFHAIWSDVLSLRELEDLFLPIEE